MSHGMMGDNTVMNESKFFYGFFWPLIVATVAQNARAPQEIYS
jgi:hypothetical protein